MRYFHKFLATLFCIAILTPNVFPQKAVIIPEDIDSMIVFERRFVKNENKPAPPDSSSFEFRRGTRKILFVAGHATAQKREGKTKPADGGTGSLAVELNKLLNVPVLYTVFLSESDPNFEDNNAFKDTLAKIISKIKPIIVLDLHASNTSRPYDIDFGTMKGTSFLKRKDLLVKLKTVLEDEGLINQSQDFFSASKNQTITKFVHARNIPCIQMEINGNWLQPEKGNLNAQKSAQLLQALYRFVNTTTK